MCTLQICKRSNDLRESNDDISRMFVLEGEGRAAHQSKVFVDIAVYTRNRAFRLAFSSKAGKSALLLPTSRFRSSKLVSVLLLHVIPHIFVDMVLVSFAASDARGCYFLIGEHVRRSERLWFLMCQTEREVFMNSLIGKAEDGCQRLLTFNKEVCFDTAEFELHFCA